MRIRKKQKKGYTVVYNDFLNDKNLGINARGMLITMLALPDGWNFSIKGLAALLPDGEKKVGTALKELETNGYLVRKRLFDEQGKIIDWEYTISDQKLNIGMPETFNNPHSYFGDVENPHMDKAYVDEAYVENRNDYQYTNISNTNKLITNQSINQSEWIDMMDRIKSNITYDLIVTNDIKQALDEIVELIVECCMAINPIRVGKQEIPAEVVKSRMLKLNSEHIVYALGCMEKNHSKITNIRSYLITVLYNAVATMDNYYRAEVNYDLHSE